MRLNLRISTACSCSRNINRERETILHHLRTYKYCGVNTVIFHLHKIHNRFLNPVACCYYNVLTVNILFYYVISVINREVSVFVYVLLLPEKTLQRLFSSYHKYRPSCWLFFFTFHMFFFKIPAEAFKPSSVITYKIVVSILNESTKFFLLLIVHLHQSFYN